MSFGIVLGIGLAPSQLGVGITLDPAIAFDTGPTASGGSTVDSVITVSATAAGADSIEYRYLRDASPISGASASTYTLVGADDATAVQPQARTIKAGHYPGAWTNASAAINVTYTAPTAAGALADLVDLVRDVAVSYDLSGDWTGGGMTFAVQSGTLPTGLTLSSAGTLSGTPTVATATGTLVIRGTNSGGFADSAFDIAVDDPVSVQSNAGGTFTVSVADNGDVTFTPTPDNWGDTTYVATSAQVDALATAPHYLHEGILSGTTGLGDTLTYVPGFPIADGDGPSPTTTWEWQADTVAFTPSSGANGLTHIITASEQGKDVRVVETTAQTGYTSTPATSNVIAVPSGAATNYVDTERAPDEDAGSGAIASYVDLAPGTQLTQNSGYFNFRWYTDALASGVNYTLAGTIGNSGTRDAAHARLRLYNPSDVATINENINAGIDAAGDYAFSFSATTTEAGVHEFYLEIDQTSTPQTVTITNVTLEVT